MPVLVWIFGGGFQMGEASRELYSPDYLMMENVVLVSIAYRLGPFGNIFKIHIKESEISEIWLSRFFVP